MDKISSWLATPADAYRLWQETDATDVDGRPFSARSIRQHAAMFDRFMRHLTAHQENLATFSAALLDSFLADVDRRCTAGTTTRLRYVKLLNRLCRHLASIGLREANPASDYERRQVWPENEPEPLFLDPAADARLQAYVQPQAADEPHEARNRAFVALLLGTGITSAEIRATKAAELVTDTLRPEVHVPKRGARDERRIPLPTFALTALALYHSTLLDNGPQALLFLSVST
jgi:site-specific recombinase XerD